MKRAIIFLASLATLMASYSLLVRASLPQVPSNTWSATGDMVVSRAGASAVLLLDGRVLVTGGTNEGGASASAERFSPTAGGFLATPSMENARANHTSTVLEDGRVLVVGGINADGHATAAAELYDSNTNAWTPVAPLYHARSGHSATLLWDGRVLIAGGDDTGVADATLEVFDPISSTFSPVDAVLSAARTGHAAASLADGRVLIVGGFDGTSALASVDIYDPKTNTASAGPSLTVGRAGHSATTLLDGRVLIAGGASDSSELASAEVFDPSTNTFTAAGNMLTAARQRHVAFLLPHNNNVLIVGGTSGGMAVASAELYTAWEGNGGTFCATAVCGSGFAGPAAPNAARAWATGAALSVPAGDTIRTGPSDGLLLLAGGSATSAASNPTSSAELYGFATVKTDKSDYAPGNTVTITGSGWVPGESVTLLLRESPEFDEHQLVSVTADENGDIVSARAADDAFARELQEFTRARLSQHEYPRHVAFVPELPKTPAGKVNRKTLREAETAAPSPAD
jgi:N-acetylneuraminic acid mutarotase